MPISGLIITYADGPDGSRAAGLIGGHADIELGERLGFRQAAVVDTPSREVDRATWSWLNGLAGVEFVDVAYIKFDDEMTGPTGDGDRAEVRSGLRFREAQR